MYIKSVCKNVCVNGGWSCCPLLLKQKGTIVEVSVS